MAPSRGVLRVVRVMVFALMTVTLALVGHIAGGGTLPTRTALVAVPIVMLAVNPLAARQRRVPGLLVVMGVIEAVLHGAFMLASSVSSCSAVVTGGHGDGVHGVHGVQTVGSGGSAVPMVVHCEAMAGSMGQVAHPSAGLMLLAHVVATVLTVLLMSRGEAAVWFIASCVTHIITRRLVRLRALVVTPRPALVRGPLVRLPLDPAPARSIQQRGPPFEACFS